MPAKSRAQFRFMAMAANNPESIKNRPKGLTQAKAQEFVSKTKDYSKLPEKKKKGSFKKLDRYMK